MPALDAVQRQQFTTWLDAQIRSTKETIAWGETLFGFDYTESGMRKPSSVLGIGISNRHTCRPKPIRKPKRSG